VVVVVVVDSRGSAVNGDVLRRLGAEVSMLNYRSRFIVSWWAGKWQVDDMRRIGAGDKLGGMGCSNTVW
jgi:hypothetical protein